MPTPLCRQAGRRPGPPAPHPPHPSLQLHLIVTSVSHKMTLLPNWPQQSYVQSRGPRGGKAEKGVRTSRLRRPWKSGGRRLTFEAEMPSGSLTQQPLPVLDEQLCQGRHLLVGAVLADGVDSHPDPCGLGAHKDSRLLQSTLERKADWGGRGAGARARGLRDVGSVFCPAAHSLYNLGEVLSPSMPPVSTYRMVLRAPTASRGARIYLASIYTDSSTQVGCYPTLL